ncbi:homeotic protein female sterile-like [Ananas comosus]|uniref:Homeotic protein female sterile-like n=1 Tax=Ananas comosus TaxID=4615 RepID=A0A6P5EBK3_ANACO|nr:homeotic protein female sterile-like [Ananas comosus]
MARSSSAVARARLGLRVTAAAPKACDGGGSHSGRTRGCRRVTREVFKAVSSGGDAGEKGGCSAGAALGAARGGGDGCQGSGGGGSADPRWLAAAQAGNNAPRPRACPGWQQGAEAAVAAAAAACEAVTAGGDRLEESPEVGSKPEGVPEVRITL